MSIDTSSVYTAQFGRTSAAQAQVQAQAQSSAGSSSSVDEHHSDGPGNDHDKDDLGAAATTAGDGAKTPAHRGNAVNTKA